MVYRPPHPAQTAFRGFEDFEGVGALESFAGFGGGELLGFVGLNKGLVLTLRLFAQCGLWPFKPLLLPNSFPQVHVTGSEVTGAVSLCLVPVRDRRFSECGETAANRSNASW